MRTRPRARLAALLATAALIASACATDDGAGDPGQTEPPSPTATTERPTASPSASETDAVALGASCEADRFTVEYPIDWHVNDGDTADPCRVFHPEPFGEPEGESLHYAVRAHIDRVGYDVATDQHSDPDEQLSREEITVDGRQAVVIEERSSGEALVPEGARSYTAVVDLDGEIFVAATYDIGGTDYERDKQVMRAMLDTIGFTPSGG